MNDTCILCPQFFDWYSIGEKVSNSIFIFRAISLTSVGKPSCFFYTFYLVYIWHCRIKLFLRHLPNCPCSNFSRYVDLFQEISLGIAKQLRFHRSNYIILDGSARTITLGVLRMEYLQWKTHMRFEYFSRNFLAEYINRRKNITADGLFRKNGTTTIWIWKHWNNCMVNNC